MSIKSFIGIRFGITTHFCAGIWSLTSLYFILSFEAGFYKPTILWLYLTIWGIITAYATIRAWFWVSVIFFVSWFWSKWIMHDKWSSHWGAGKPRPLCHELSALNTNTTAFCLGIILLMFAWRSVAWLFLTENVTVWVYSFEWMFAWRLVSFLI